LNATVQLTTQEFLFLVYISSQLGIEQSYAGGRLPVKLSASWKNCSAQIV
jgi:hypothetical protein